MMEDCRVDDGHGLPSSILNLRSSILEVRWVGYVREAMDSAAFVPFVAFC
jgi:hypothetical protein